MKPRPPDIRAQTACDHPGAWLDPYSFVMGLDWRREQLEQDFRSAPEADICNFDPAFVHEYEHYLQLSTTSFGISNYLLYCQLIARFSCFLDWAAQEHIALTFPLKASAESSSSDSLMKPAHELYIYFQSQQFLFANPCLFHGPGDGLLRMSDLLKGTSGPYDQVCEEFSPFVIGFHYTNGHCALIPALPSVLSDNVWLLGISAIVESSAVLTQLNVLKHHTARKGLNAYFKTLTDRAKNDNRFHVYVACTLLLANLFQSSDMLKIGMVQRVLCDLTLLGTSAYGIWRSAIDKVQAEPPGIIYLHLAAKLKRLLDESAVQLDGCTHDDLACILTGFASNLYHKGSSLLRPLHAAFEELIEMCEGYLTRINEEPFSSMLPEGANRALSEFTRNVFIAATRARLSDDQFSGLHLNNLDPIVRPSFNIELDDTVVNLEGQDYNAAALREFFAPLTVLFRSLICCEEPICPYLRLGKKLHARLLDTYFDCVGGCNEDIPWPQRACPPGSVPNTVRKLM